MKITKKIVKTFDDFDFSPSMPLEKSPYVETAWENDIFFIDEEDFRHPLKYEHIDLKENQSFLESRGYVNVPKKILNELKWKIGDIIWFRIFDKEMSVVEIGKVASSIEDFQKSIQSFAKDEENDH